MLPFKQTVRVEAEIHAEHKLRAEQRVVCLTAPVSHHQHSTFKLFLSSKCEFSAFQHCLKAMSLSCLQGHHVLMLFWLFWTETQRISVSAEWCLYVAVMILMSWRTVSTIPPTGLFSFLSLRPFSLHTSLIGWTRWWLFSVVVSMITPQPWRLFVRVQRGSGNTTTNTTNTWLRDAHKATGWGLGSPNTYTETVEPECTEISQQKIFKPVLFLLWRKMSAVTKKHVKQHIFQCRPVSVSFHSSCPNKNRSLFLFGCYLASLRCSGLLWCFGSKVQTAEAKFVLNVWLYRPPWWQKRLHPGLGERRVGVLVCLNTEVLGAATDFPSVFVPLYD